MHQNTACTCRNCGPIGSKPTIVEVTITIFRIRPGWEQTGYGTVWGEVETGAADLLVESIAAVQSNWPQRRTS